MRIREALTLLLDEYPKECKKPFTNNSLAETIRNDISVVVRSIIGTNERYIIKGSAGQGNWAKVPWIAVFDRFITKSAQQGYYVVYVFREDFTGVYISLNQGITIMRGDYGVDAKEALRVKAADLGARLASIKTGWASGPIELATSLPTSLGAYYEQGSIYSKYYALDNLPSDNILEQDLLDALDMYFVIMTKEISPHNLGQYEDDEEGLGDEDLRLLKSHKRVERNKNLANRVKRIHGYKCQVCGMNFQQTYGDLGRGYIEAHHLIPLTELKGKKVALSPRTDFAVLCANCHRMIHKTKLTDNIQAFKERHFTP